MAKEHEPQLKKVPNSGAQNPKQHQRDILCHFCYSYKSLVHWCQYLNEWVNIDYQNLVILQSDKQEDVIGPNMKDAMHTSYTTRVAMKTKEEKAAAIQAEKRKKEAEQKKECKNRKEEPKREQRIVRHRTPDVDSDSDLRFDYGCDSDSDSEPDYNAHFHPWNKC